MAASKQDAGVGERRRSRLYRTPVRRSRSLPAGGALPYMCGSSTRSGEVSPQATEGLFTQTHPSKKEPGLHRTPARDGLTKRLKRSVLLLLRGLLRGLLAWL